MNAAHIRSHLIARILFGFIEGQKYYLSSNVRTKRVARIRLLCKMVGPGHKNTNLFLSVAMQWYARIAIRSSDDPSFCEIPHSMLLVCTMARLFMYCGERLQERNEGRKPWGTEAPTAPNELKRITKDWLHRKCMRWRSCLFSMRGENVADAVEILQFCACYFHSPARYRLIGSEESSYETFCVPLSR